MEGSSASTADQEFFQTKRRRVLRDGDDVDVVVFTTFCRQNNDPAGHVWGLLSIFSLLIPSVRNTTNTTNITKMLILQQEPDGDNFMMARNAKFGLKSPFFFVEFALTILR